MFSCTYEKEFPKYFQPDAWFQKQTMVLIPDKFQQKVQLNSLTAMIHAWMWKNTKCMLGLRKIDVLKTCPQKRRMCTKSTDKILLPSSSSSEKPRKNASNKMFSRINCNGVTMCPAKNAGSAGSKKWRRKMTTEMESKRHMELFVVSTTQLVIFWSQICINGTEASYQIHSVDVISPHTMVLTKQELEYSLFECLALPLDEAPESDFLSPLALWLELRRDDPREPFNLCTVSWILPITVYKNKRSQINSKGILQATLQVCSHTAPPCLEAGKNQNDTCFFFQNWTYRNKMKPISESDANIFERNQ